MVFDDVLGGPEFVRDVPVRKSPGNELDDFLLPSISNPPASSLLSKHNCLRYRRVASFTRLIPPLIPNFAKSRLKWALTVRRFIPIVFAISALPQPCKSRLTISCSRGPNRTGSCIASSGGIVLVIQTPFPRQLCGDSMNYL